MDADIQAMDGNHPTVQALDSGDLPTRSFPSVDQGHLLCISVAIPGRWISASLPKRRASNTCV